MKILKIILSAFIFVFISFAVYGIASNINGGCPFTGLDSFRTQDTSEIKFILPLTMFAQGIVFSFWYTLVQKYASFNLIKKGYVFGAIAFFITRFFGEIYCYALFTEYTVFIIIFGMICGLISNILWGIIAQRLLKTV